MTIAIITAIVGGEIMEWAVIIIEFGSMTIGIYGECLNDDVILR